MTQEFIDTFSPEVCYLRGYQSAPTATKTAKSKPSSNLNGRYYRSSDTEFRAVKALQDENVLDNRADLVATSFERDSKMRRSLTTLDNESCIQFKYMTIWLKRISGPQMTAALPAQDGQDGAFGMSAFNFVGLRTQYGTFGSIGRQRRCVSVKA